MLGATIKLVQVGLVNERAFLVNASLGLYPQLMQDREEYKRQYGRYRPVALWSGLMTLLREHRRRDERGFREADFSGDPLHVCGIGKLVAQPHAGRSSSLRCQREGGEPVKIRHGLRSVN